MAESDSSCVHSFSWSEPLKHTQKPHSWPPCRPPSQTHTHTAEKLLGLVQVIFEDKQCRRLNEETQFSLPSLKEENRLIHTSQHLLKIVNVYTLDGRFRTHGCWCSASIWRVRVCTISQHRWHVISRIKNTAVNKRSTKTTEYKLKKAKAKGVKGNRACVCVIHL